MRSQPLSRIWRIQNLPSEKAKRRVHKGRQTDILAGEPKSDHCERELKESNWSITSNQLHEMLVVKFPHLNKALRHRSTSGFEHLRLREGPEKQIYPELKKKTGSSSRS